MIGILLLILKIIGWILLSLVLLILTVFCLILFVPIRYKVEGGNTDELAIQGSIRWLLHIVKFDVEQGKGLKWRLRVFWKDIKSVGYPKKVRRKKKRVTAKSKVLTVGKSQVHKIESKVENVSKVQKPVENKKPVENNKPIENKKPIKEKKDKSNKSPIGDQLKAGYAQFRSFMDDESYKGVVKFVLKHVWKVLKSIFPKKAKIDLKVGFEDPALTGVTVGMMSILYAVFGKGLTIEPNFKQKVLTGEVKLKGRIYIFVPVYHGVRIILDRRVKKLIAANKK